jgi:hypothetical protein
MGDAMIRFFERVFDRVADLMTAYIRWATNGPEWHWLVGIIVPIVLVWLVFILAILIGGKRFPA